MTRTADYRKIHDRILLSTRKRILNNREKKKTTLSLNLFSYILIYFAALLLFTIYM